jgi:hypothetical protein
MVSCSYYLGIIIIYKPIKKMVLKTKTILILMFIIGELKSIFIFRTNENLNTLTNLKKRKGVPQ